MTPADVIRAKRDGRELSHADLDRFIRNFLTGEVADYQMTAFLMAVFFRGMTDREAAALTRVMVETGTVLSYPEIPGRKVDKHSTGGVGDFVSLPLAPLVAACGVPVPMISGRSLGHTGGTLDKLESIPGLSTDLAPDVFRRILRDVGFVMGGQTSALAPADRLMYALRDVTATVESVPLIVSSILSKKVAEGIDALVLDVKFGRGAFMPTEEAALELAGELTRVGTLMGKQVVAFVTDMDLPLGRAVGNGPEMHSAVECLRGHGPADVMELVYTLGGAMLVLGGAAATWGEGRTRLEAAVHDGSGLARLRALVRAQGGDDTVLDHPERLDETPARVPLRAERDGWVGDIDPRVLGEAAIDLGAGRRRAEDDVDPRVGFRLEKTVGEETRAGDVLAWVLAPDAARGERLVTERLAGAFRIQDAPPPRRVLVRHLVTATGRAAWAGDSTWTRLVGETGVAGGRTT